MNSRRPEPTSGGSASDGSVPEEREADEVTIHETVSENTAPVESDRPEPTRPRGGDRAPSAVAAAPTGTSAVEAAPAAPSVGAGSSALSWSGARLPRIAIVLVTLAAGWIVITGLMALKDIAAPALLTLNLVIVAYPVQAALTRHGVPRVVGAVVSGVIVFAILLAFFAALAWSLTSLVEEIPNYQDRFVELYHQLVSQLQHYGVSESQALEQAQQALSPSRIGSLASTALGGITGALSLLLVAVTVIFVILIDTMTFPARMRVADAHQPDVVRALVEFAQGVRRYWVVSSIFGLIVAVLDVAFLLFLGVPLALVWGVLSFLTNYIPNIGFVLGIVPPALMALLANDPITALWVVVGYCVINFFIQSVIQPKFNGDAVGVNATISLLSLLFWAFVLGPLGALLALPATLLCKTLLLDVDPKVRWLNAFVASDPDTADDKPGDNIER